MLRIKQLQGKQKFFEKTEKTKNVPNYKIPSVAMDQPPNVLIVPIFGRSIWFRLKFIKESSLE